MAGSSQEVVDPAGWQWRPFRPSHHPTDFWIGTDSSGTEWIAKMYGSFYGYRELVFERLMRRVGWPCLVSAFAVLDRRAPPVMAGRTAERTQLVSQFVAEHAYEACGPDCLQEAVKIEQERTGGDPLDILMRSKIQSAASIARSCMLAPVLGGNEPSGWLLTVDHAVVLIDGDQMFASGPTDPTKTSWWSRDNGSASPSGRQLTYQVCAAIGALTDEHLKEALTIPAGIKVKALWDIRKHVFAARDHARAFARLHGA